MQADAGIEAGQVLDVPISISAKTNLPLVSNYSALSCPAPCTIGNEHAGAERICTADFGAPGAGLGS